MGKNYGAYSEFIETGVSWLPKVPSHWGVFYGRRVFSNRREIASTNDQQLAASQKYGVVPQSLMMELMDSKVMLALKGTSSFRHVESGDFVISLRSFEGGIEYSKYNGCVSPAYTVLKPQKHMYDGYFRFLFKSRPYIAALQSTTDSLRDGKSITFEQFAKILLPLPTLHEQQKIANFLDHETTKIDTLIEKQQQLIKLLKEKRQAVISHAVTKGLNPNAPMRDSGVEWLGEVPEHWEVKRLKHVSPKIGVGLVINPSTYTIDEGVYFIFGGDVKEYSFDLSSTRRMSKENSDQLLPSRLNHRDLVSIRVGYPGVTAVVPEELEGANCASVIIIRRGDFNSDWLCAAMNVWVGRQQVDLASYGAAQKQFNVSDAIDFVFPVPPPAEQDQIANHVQKSLERFGALITKAEWQIDLLKERRTALISAAVTGKIDVRDWQPPAGESANYSSETQEEAAL